MQNDSNGGWWGFGSISLRLLCSLLLVLTAIGCGKPFPITAECGDHPEHIGLESDNELFEWRGSIVRDSTDNVSKRAGIALTSTNPAYWLEKTGTEPAARSFLQVWGIRGCTENGDYPCMGIVEESAFCPEREVDGRDYPPGVQLHVTLKEYYEDGTSGDFELLLTGEASPDWQRISMDIDLEAPASRYMGEYKLKMR